MIELNVSNGKEESKNDEEYVVDLCDSVLGLKASRQHTFDFLRGDGDPGRKLPVDAYYQKFNLVVEYRERQHTESVKLWDKKETISGVSRGKQRQIYDQRRRDVLPKQGLELVELNFGDFECDNQKRLIRNTENDKAIVENKLKKWTSSQEELHPVEMALWIAGFGFAVRGFEQLISKFRRSVLHEIDAWVPAVHCKKESDYRSSLAMHLRTHLRNTEVLEEVGFDRRRVDISVECTGILSWLYGERLAIELKLNLSRNTELDRLVGQVVGYQEAKYDGAIVVSLNPEPNFEQLLDKKQNVESLEGFLIVVQKDTQEANH